MSSATRQKLGEISESCLGKMLDKEKNKGDFHPYLANYNVRWGQFDLSNVQEMKFEDHEHERYGLEYGDLVICEGGEPGRCAVWRDNAPDMKIQKALHRLRVKSGFSFDFLYYRLVLASRMGELQKYFIGSTIKHLTGVALKQVEFDFPSHGEQVSIAAVLRSLDKKIELNNRINAELEAMAKTLYDYWFVQFDFPDANGNPYKTSGGKMAYNPTLKREIPEGWQYSTIGAIEPNIVTGKTPSKDNSEYFGGNVPFITIGDIRGNTYVVSTEETLTEQGASTQKNKFLPEDSICVTCIASPGLVGFVTTPAQTNQQINSIICGSDINKYYLYFAIKSYFEGAKAKTGNTFANMNKGDFSSIGVLKPSSQVLRLYHKKVYQLFQQIKCRSLEIQQLVKLRDWLLPMLMNGQLTIGSAN